MRISDWSSYVCSSDLASPITTLLRSGQARLRSLCFWCADQRLGGIRGRHSVDYRAEDHQQDMGLLRGFRGWRHHHEISLVLARSEERRVGKEWARTGRVGCVPIHKKKKKIYRN